MLEALIPPCCLSFCLAVHGAPLCHFVAGQFIGGPAVTGCCLPLTACASCESLADITHPNDSTAAVCQSSRHLKLSIQTLCAVDAIAVPLSVFDSDMGRVRAQHLASIDTYATLLFCAIALFSVVTAVACVCVVAA